ncbi:MAG: hypothetical protein WBG46_04430 [Nonlabens sp.]
MKKLLLLFTVIIAFASCSKDEQNPFEWKKDRVGHITKETQVYQLDSLYANDSIVNPIKGDEFSNGANEIEIFEKGGKHLLTLTPTEALDSTATIENIILRDDRFKTKEGITINSTFAEISKAYNITGIDNMIDDAIIWVDDQNFYFAIIKEELPSEVKYDMTADIEKTMIPEGIKPERVFVAW